MKRVLFALLLLPFGLSLSAQSKQDSVKPTEDDAIVKVIIKNNDNKSVAGDVVTIMSKLTETTYSGITDTSGVYKAIVLNGERYTIKYRIFDKDVLYREIDLPKLSGYVEYPVLIKYDLPKDYVLSDVNFDAGKSTIRSSSFTSLDKLALFLKNKQYLHFEISGHTDNSGDIKVSQKLSEERAKAVKTYLVSKGVSADEIQTAGYGKTKPIADNATPVGKHKNNRVEITLVK